MTLKQTLILVPALGILALSCSSSSVRGDDAPSAAAASTDEKTASSAPPTAVHTGTVIRSDADTVPGPRASPRAAPLVPEEYAGLRSTLMARHTEDLPSRKSLQKQPKGQDGLRWLAQNDESLLVRARALTLLGLFPSSSNQSLLLKTMEDGSSHPKLRSAAIQGLAGWDLNQEEALRNRIAKVLYDANTRVALETITVLQKYPSARPDLKRLAGDPNVPRVIREKARKATE